MPTYDYRCNECQKILEVTHSIKEDPAIECPSCLEKGRKSIMERMISFNVGGFIFKQWTESKAYKVKRDKHHESKELSVRQMDRWGGGPRLQPNVAGHEVESWSDAQKLAKEAGMRSDSYAPLVEKEKHISKSSGVDDSKWKATKEAASS
jgi:putative FmdB family regulatory protein